MIVGSRRATITFPKGTQVMIEDALLYLDSTHTLISFSLLLSLPDMAMKFLKEFLLLRLDCTTHTLNPYHMLHIR
jgi:hypothetical protein